MSATLAELRDLRADIEAAQRSLLLTSESVMIAGEDFAEARTTFGLAQLGHVRADLLEHLVVLMRAARTLERVEREIPAGEP